MWADANIVDHQQYYVSTYYNEYKHYKNGDKMQKPERCHCWCRDPSSCERLYKCLGPDNFLPPLLHLEISMVNQAWEGLETGEKSTNR